MWLAFRDCDSTLQMEFSWATIVEKTVSDLAVLLNFDQGYSGTNGMNCPGRDVEEISWLDFEPLHQFFDAAIDR